MEEEFYRVLNKYQGYGWDSLTKEEQSNRPPSERIGIPPL